MLIGFNNDERVWLKKIVKYVRRPIDTLKPKQNGWHLADDIAINKYHLNSFVMANKQ